MKTSKDKLIEENTKLQRIFNGWKEGKITLLEIYDAGYLQATADKRARIVEMLEGMKKGEQQYCYAYDQNGETITDTEPIEENITYNQALSDAQDIINNPTKDI